MKEGLLVKIGIFEVKAKKVFLEATLGQSKHPTKFMT